MFLFCLHFLHALSSNPIAPPEKCKLTAEVGNSVFKLRSIV